MTTTTATQARRLGIARGALVFVRLKWRLLLGGLRGSTQQRLQTLLSAVVSTLFGLFAAVILSAIGQGWVSAAEVVVVFLPVTVLGLGVLSIATGVEATIDPRHLASEPLTRWELGVGMLASAAVGPAALLAVLAAVGLVLGWGGGGLTGWVITFAVVLAWWTTLVLFSRSTANLLGTFASGRFRQIAQFVASGAALLVWLGAQILARHTEGWTQSRWDRLASLASWTPPGQLGRALGSFDDPIAALGHLALGVSWLPILLWISVASTTKLAYSPPRPTTGGTRSRPRPQGMRSGLLRLLPEGPVGTMTARTLTTKLRTPRQSVNTVTALLVGAGVFFLGPLLDSGTPDPRIVMVGGLLHFAVLFDGNNAFGMDGAAIWIEVASGSDASVLIRSKVASSLLVMALPAVVLPISLAVMTGGWEWLPAAWLIAVGSLLAAAGVSIASASLAPVALPDSPNPLAAGDTGQGCVAGLMLAVGMLLLGLTTAPVAIAVAWASGRSVTVTTATALLAPVVGACVLWGGAAAARARLGGREAELIQNVTPAR